MLTRFYLLFALFLFAALHVPQAFAYNATDFLGEDEEEEEEETDAPGLLPNYGFDMVFVRKAGALPNEATLRILQPLSISGCITIKPAKHKIRKDPPYMWIDIGSPVVKFDDKNCNSGTSSTQIDITFNHDELLEDGMETISFKNDLGSDMYKVEVDEYHLTLKPKSENLFKPYEKSGKEKPLTHWFYPDNTIVLSVPLSPADEDLTGQIRALAYQKGLIDAKTLIEEFEPPSTKPNTMYFIDQPGTLAKTLSHDKTSAFGTVTVTEIFYGPEGLYERPKALEVHAKLPGLLE